VGKISIEDIEVYAFHGHLVEEREIGARYIVNLEIDATIEKSCFTDKLEDTCDYQTACEIVKTEMKTSSALLEHVAMRIARGILESSQLVQSVKVRVAKMNPPVGVNVKAVSVEFCLNREQ
jgi:7,8-dihydroneopterin aldolase/epimerase/oxygenase